MNRAGYGDLLAFLAVARERSFTKGAAQLEVSPSALSHTIRGLESRLGLRLLTRTTRSVSPTEAGEQLLRSVGPLFEEVGVAMSSLTALREKPAGRIRITAVEHAADTILWPAIRKLVTRYPDIEVEISADYRLADLAAERFDAGVRLGEQVSPGMIAMRIGPDMRMAVVASPKYIERYGKPQAPGDLTGHRCIQLRLPTHGGLLPWQFRKGRRDLGVKVHGQLVFNSLAPILQAAVDGFGLAYTVADSVQEQLQAGQLVSVLEDWCPVLQGYHLYYSSRRHKTPAFSLLLEALRQKSEGRG